MRPSEELNRARPRLDCSKDKILVKQEFKDEVNINTIMAKAAKGIAIDPALLSYNAIPHYGDMSEVPDLMTAHNIVQEAMQQFDMLPLEIKREFDNDPAKLVLFMQDENNKDKAIELGLIPAPIKAISEEPAPEGEPAPDA